ncbi:MAG: NAD(P)H-binding protein [Gemmatimonadetes bacterium]|nr:NAD(P)H-binding protein [Gemmatimonadota bacterium]
MIVVTGATGTIGRHLIARLAGQEDVLAISRNPPAGSSVGAVRWARIDLEDRGAVREACNGARALFVCTSNDERMVRLQKNTIRAARDAGVSRIVKLSALGASDHSKSVIGTWHYAIEHVLVHAGGEWTVLRPHVFMQNLLDQRAAIRNQRAVRSAAGDGRIPMIDTRDVADVAAAVLTAGGHAEQTYTLTGGEALTWDEIASTLSRVLDWPVRYVRETPDELWQRLRAAGVPHLARGGAARARGVPAHGRAHRDDDGHSPRRHAPRTFETFVRDHAERFRNSPA